MFSFFGNSKNSISIKTPEAFVWTQLENSPMCFRKESLPYNPNDSITCLDRHKNSDLLPCGIGINPTQNKIRRILIVGSTGVLGIALSSEFSNRNIEFAEIRSHFQFSISRRDIYRMLKQLNIIAVVLFANNEIFKQNTFTGNFTYNSIFDFCLRREIPIFKIVKEFDNSLITEPFKKMIFIQIQTKPVWGPIFLTPHQRKPGSYFYQCSINEPISITSESERSQNYVFSLDLAKYITDIILKTLKSRKVSTNYSSPDLLSISTTELLQLLHEKQCKINYRTTRFSPSEDIQISEENRKNFNIVWNSLQTTENIGERYKYKPYASLVVCASDASRIRQLFSLSLQVTNTVIHLYPNLALEFVVLYCPSNENLGKFYSVFDIPPKMKKFIRIIELPQEYINQRKRLFNITYFPEFDLKNIGIRRAKGEYIFAINSDIILPTGFFECVQKQSFSSLTYFRTHRRITHFKKTSSLFNLYSKEESRFITQLYSIVCYNLRYYDDYDRNGCGDFQGGHRNIWFNINGFLESSYVFHVDTLLSLDFSAIPTYLFVNVLGSNYHLEHEKISNKTEHFKFYNQPFKNAIRQGVSLSMLPEFKRPNWGAKGMEFTEY